MDALFEIPSVSLAVLDAPTEGTTHAALRVTLACVLFLGLAIAIAHVRWRACRETLRELHRLHGLEPLESGRVPLAQDADGPLPVVPRKRRAAGRPAPTVRYG